MKLLLIAVLINLAMPDADKNGNSFTGDQGGEPIFSFGVITDVHFCNSKDSGSRFYNKSLPRLRSAMQSLKASPADFVISLGDLIDHDYDSFEPVLNVIDSAGLETWHCLGNHDFSVDRKHKKRLPLPLPEKEGYYSFAHKGFRFIVLNGNEISTYGAMNRSSIKKAEELIARMQSEGCINAIDWNGGISEKQMLWIDEELSEAESENEKVFIFCHFPIWPEDKHNLLNYKDIISLLEKYHNIIAWFSGHNHEGNYGNFNMIHCVTLKAMVESEEMTSWSLVEVYGNKIWIKGTGREKSLILAY